MGFTLVEVLIALMIFAVVATITTAVLREVIEQHIVVKSSSERFQKQVLFDAQFTKDIHSIVAQPVYSPTQVMEPAFTVLPHQISFTIETQLSSPALARIVYIWQPGQHLLIRKQYAIVHGIQSANFEEQVLLRNIENIEWSFLSLGQGFSSNWPPGGLGNIASLEQMPIPRAIQVAIFQSSQKTLLLYPIPTTNLMANQQ